MCGSCHAYDLFISNLRSVYALIIPSPSLTLITVDYKKTLLKMLKVSNVSDVQEERRLLKSGRLPSENENDDYVTK